LSKIIEPIIIRRLLSRFSHYDLISAHSIVPGTLAREINKRYNIPYCVTWHGSDIHTEPFSNKSAFKNVSDVMGGACCNMFVSRALQQTAVQINKDIVSEVLYNAASDKFYRYDDECRMALRRQHCKIVSSKVVAFAGGLVSIKNADILPDIFSSIQDEIDEQLEFWIIGDGKLRGIIENKLASIPNLRCKLWGNQPVAKMLELLNCVDVLVLPSKNEGLPLIVVEALQSGANVVASDVGGIKEVLGEDNVIILGDNFIERFSSKVVELLTTDVPSPKIPQQFDWQMTSDVEDRLYTRILKEK
ncbi:MAG: glycosyltransferase, partial [Alistipes sp.]|nr:glycosyltransferase [Alistipes sp.]